MSAASLDATPSVKAPLWLLALVTLSGTMAMHIFVPALPIAGQALGASASSMQQTITLYVMGLAMGQLVYGPLSDAIGRKPTLLVGLSIYLAASLMALFAPSLQWLVAARLLQALGGAAGLTLGRAIVRDTAEPSQATRNLAMLNLLTLVGPGLSPILGAYLADHFGWRSIYVFLVLIGSAMLLFTAMRMPESNPHRRALKLRSFTGDYAQLLSNPRFMAYALGGSCITTTLYPYLATVSYIVHERMGMPIRSIGWFAAATIAGASLGTLLTRRMAGRWSAARLLAIGAGLALCMAVVLLSLHLLGLLTPALLVATTVTMIFGAGIAGPAALARAMSAMPQLTGSAAGFYGFGQMAMGAVGTMVVGFGADPVVACAATQIALTATALASFRFANARG